MSTQIHPTAIIDPKATLGTNVSVGPCAVIGPDVCIGNDSVIHNHATVTGHTTLGHSCEVFPGAVIGSHPQDLKYRGGDTKLIVGNNCTFRECCTVHVGTELGGGETVIGNNCFIMAYVHIAHDCKLGNRIVISNATQLAGHVYVDDDARISGLCGIHHFVTIGRGSFVAGSARLSIDVPPFTIAEGHPARIFKLNEEGMKRRSMDKEAIGRLKKAFRILIREKGPRDQAFLKLEEENLLGDPAVKEFVDFVKASGAGEHGRALEAKRKIVPAQERDGDTNINYQFNKEAKSS